MKRLILSCVLCLLILTATQAYAHPPTDIKTEYNLKTRILTAIITHPVADMAKHHVGKVDISLNGAEIIEHKIIKQDTNTTQFVVYMVPDAKVGDIISVEAYCNINGKLRKDIKVSE
ncbi:MAG: hypothetical protein ABH815_04515 [Candidatus Omnitrophota bacterium]